MSDQTVEIRLPPKKHVDLVLAIIAGALAVLVVLTARGAIVSHPNAATPSPVVTPASTETVAPAVAPNAPRAAPKEKGKGHD